ncbi:hypothetical protein BH09PAT2_BH09PAT2_05140 [soil metagenome]
MRRKLLYAVMVFAVVLAMFTLPKIPTAQAQSCRYLGVYTSYWLGKPAIWIQAGQNPPTPSRMTIGYFSGSAVETVPSPNDWGVRTDAPAVQNPNGNGWYTYFIATRWIWTHPKWDDDWRWTVRYC